MAEHIPTRVLIAPDGSFTLTENGKYVEDNLGIVLEVEALYDHIEDQFSKGNSFVLIFGKANVTLH